MKLYNPSKYWELLQSLVTWTSGGNGKLSATWPLSSDHQPDWGAKLFQLVDHPFSRNTLWVNTPTHIFGPVMHIHANTEYGQPAICGECLRCHSTLTYRIQFQFQVYISRAVETCELWQVLGSWISVSEVKTHLRRAEELRGWKVKSPSYQNQPSYFTGM